MVIQMIPMVVGDNKVVDARHVFGFVNFAAGKGFVGEADRGGLAEHGINQESFPCLSLKKVDTFGHKEKYQ